MILHSLSLVIYFGEQCTNKTRTKKKNFTSIYKELKSPKSKLDRKKKKPTMIIWTKKVDPSIKTAIEYKY